jgi:hypothetical protein
MTSVFKNDDYELFFDEVSGEIAIKNLTTGEYTFSNPYDVDHPQNELVSANDKKNAALLAQVMIKYTDTISGTSFYIGSYDSAAMLGDQIEMRRIDGGIRVEYALGSVESKRLVPYWISAERFDEKIFKTLEFVANDSGSKMTAYERTLVSQLKTIYYDKIDLSSETSESQKQTLIKRYPVLEKNPDLVFYALPTNASALTLKKVEDLILSIAKPKDLVITMGAGNVVEIGESLLKRG